MLLVAQCPSCNNKFKIDVNYIQCKSDGQISFVCPHCGTRLTGTIPVTEAGWNNAHSNIVKKIPFTNDDINKNLYKIPVEDITYNPTKSSKDEDLYKIPVEDMMYDPTKMTKKGQEYDMQPKRKR